MNGEKKTNDYRKFFVEERRMVFYNSLFYFYNYYFWDLLLSFSSENHLQRHLVQPNFYLFLIFFRCVHIDELKHWYNYY